MTIQPWGEYRPDVSDLQGNNTQRIENVVPRGDGYGPVASLAAYTDTLPADCKGAFRAISSSGGIVLFAGTATKLYKMNNGDQTWDNVSKSSGSHDYGVPSQNNWSFAQYNDFVVAVQPGNAPQVFDLSSSNYFADLGGSPPSATHVAVVGEFMVMTGIVAAGRRIQWSGRSNITNWTSGSGESDFQDFPDGGDVGVVAGGEQSGILLQSGVMRRMTYQPGNPVIFSFERISEDIGILAPYSLVKSGQRIFFISNAGFQQSINGAVPVPIGKERVDNTFLAEWDDNSPHLCIGFQDPRSTRVFFAFNTLDNTSSTFNKILCYDWLLDRWTPITGIEGKYVTPMAQVGETLETLDDLVGWTDTGDTTNGSAVITNIGDTSGLYAGMWVMGAGVPAGAVIDSVDSASQITLDQNCTADGTGVTLTAGASLDSLDVPSLDAFSVAFGREISIFQTDGRMGFMRGTPIEATFETAEQGNPRRQTDIGGCHPITDAGVVYGRASHRQTLHEDRVWTEEAPMNQLGLIPLRCETRYFRFRNRIPAGTDWTFSSGVEPVTEERGAR